jgi:hypothetical protein
MVSRLYAAAFILIVVLGLMYQRDYMKTSAAEVLMIEERMRRDTVLLAASDFVFDRYLGGQLRDRIEGANGAIMTSGALNLSGRLWISQFGPESTTRIHTETATGQMVIPQGSSRARLADAKTSSEPTNVQVLQFPEEVRMYLPDGVVKTSQVTLSFVAQLLQTKSEVEYHGTGKILRGKGLWFRLNDGTFELGGPVSGRLEPARATLHNRLP